MSRAHINMTLSPVSLCDTLSLYNASRPFLLCYPLLFGTLLALSKEKSEFEENARRFYSEALKSHSFASSVLRLIPKKSNRLTRPTLRRRTRSVLDPGAGVFAISGSGFAAAVAALMAAQVPGDFLRRTVRVENEVDAGLHCSVLDSADDVIASVVQRRRSACTVQSVGLWRAFIWTTKVRHDCDVGSGLETR